MDNENSNSSTATVSDNEEVLDKKILNMETEPESKPEPEPEAEPEAKAEPEPEPEPEPKSKSRVTIKPVQEKKKRVMSDEVRRKGLEARRQKYGAREQQRIEKAAEAILARMEAKRRVEGKQRIDRKRKKQSETETESESESDESEDDTSKRLKTSKQPDWQSYNTVQNNPFSSYMAHPFNNNPFD